MSEGKEGKSACQYPSEPVSEGKEGKSACPYPSEPVSEGKGKKSACVYPSGPMREGKEGKSKSLYPGQDGRSRGKYENDVTLDCYRENRRMCAERETKHDRIFGNFKGNPVWNCGGNYGMAAHQQYRTSDFGGTVFSF